MKKFIFTIVMLFTCSIAAQAQAQSEDYLPLVREGVRWHYVKSFIDSQEEIFVDTPYYYEFKGDSILNGKTYKKCYVTSSEPKESGLVALVREEDKKVYRKFVNDELSKPELIYNFNPAELSVDGFNLYDKIESTKNVSIEGVDCKVYQVKNAQDIDNIALIEGVGVDLSSSNYYHGNLLSPLINYCTCYVETVYTLDRLEDLDGNILYTYSQYSAIKDLKAESEKADNRYYNLMGQPVSTPTQGIYIHNGKKVVVK